MRRLSTIHSELLKDIKHLGITKDNLDAGRSQLVSKGWERADVDRALWGLGVRDRRNKYFLSRLKTLCVLSVIVIGIAIIIGGSLLADHFYKKNGVNPREDAARQADVGSQGGVISSDVAKIELRFPSTWELKSKPDGTPGLYMWQIEPLTNNASRESLAKKYQQASANATLDTSSLALLAGSGPDKIYAMTVTVYKSPDYTIEPTLDEWRQNLERQQASAGFSVDTFEKITINGYEGYSFISHISIAQISLSTQEYVFLAGDRRIELTILPAQSDRAGEINDIVRTLKIL